MDYIGKKFGHLTIVDILVIYNGVDRTLGEWSTELNIPYKTLHNRVVTLGWDIDRAFNQPLRKSPASRSTKQ